MVNLSPRPESPYIFHIRVITRVSLDKLLLYTHLFIIMHKKYLSM